MIRRSPRGVLAVAAIAALLLSGCTTTLPERNDDGTVRSIYVSPDGSGGECTEESPCAFSSGIDAAQAGAEILVLPGEYPDMQVRAPGSYSSYEENVVVRPVDPASVVMGKIETFAPNITWRDFQLGSVFYVKPDGHGTRLEKVHQNGSGTFLKSSDITVVDSVFENGASLDGLQIAGAENVLVENSIVRNYNQSGEKDYHADCVQIFDSKNVVLRGNYLGNCYNASIIFSGGAQKGLSDVLIEGNFVQGCRDKNDTCAYGTLIDLREPSATRVTLRNNTMLGGSVRISPLPELVVDRNVFDYLSNCDTPMTNSIVQQWNRGNCETPDAIGHDGNRQGEVQVADRYAGDFTLTDTESARIQPVGDWGPAPLAHDGSPMDPTLAGASN
ncbi:right-handed parallel beta-helix repeat-containing protein [Amnibacterium flavum]|uniref:Right handed beta helix domain-containing protein n=1 Tax=Amnibacterium flavum TaxID=2173173 RepID=A0A2V1HTJ1_9MICO|nr:right-handed parallel beta-helix repeat-containing protein [Amnibacterium flavum]PVZ95905.1 hypothetical protein DDQ50_05415 [Amnibacterium flavum]